ncbi:MAG: histidine--tRNA ligase [Candidatus Dojkabacteria bacterium]
MDKTKVNTLKGFKDYFSEDIIIREFVVEEFKTISKKYGFEGLETPALEYTELILGQSGKEAEKLYYRFEDQGGRDVMLKYELMISMCRAVAQNINNIVFPYKRYQVQPVWRAENVQKGRLREFTQMDIDIIGTSSMYADAEIIMFGTEFLQELGFKNFKVRISSRKILEGVLEYLGIEKEKFVDFFITVDKIKKISKNEVSEILLAKGFKQEQMEKIMNILEITDIEDLTNTIGNTETGKQGIIEVKEILSILNKAGIDKSKYEFDITLARGLASYTGPIWEFEVTDGDVGSVSGGGRYDNAISKYVGREVPATGTSFGLERLCQIIKDKNMYESKKTNIDVLVLPMDRNYLEVSMKTAESFRESNLNTMIYPPSTKLNEFLGYANKKSIPWVIVIGEEEIKKGMLLLKNMDSKEQYLLDQAEALKKILK